MKKKFKEPKLKVVNLQTMDVIATSGDTPMNAKGVTLHNLNWEGTSWHN